MIALGINVLLRTRTAQTPFRTRRQQPEYAQLTSPRVPRLPTLPNCRRATAVPHASGIYPTDALLTYLLPGWHMIPSHW